MLSFVYRKHTEIELSTWKEILKTFLGIGDFIFTKDSDLFKICGLDYISVCFKILFSISFSK